MKTTAKKKIVRYAAGSLLIVAPFVLSTTLAMPAQGSVIKNPKPASETRVASGNNESKAVKGPVLARNTPAKTETALPKEPQKVQSKQTIGRCWKRLMENLREVRHAHHKRAN